jgi:molybdopterin converting factor small subunit
MATVVFSRAQLALTGGEERVAIAAERVQDLIRAIYQRYPALEGELDEMAVAIDDDIHQDALYMRLERDSEVHFIPRIAGGC